MATGRVEVLDQYGTTWLVYPGDPADALVRSLKLEYIVLPKETILTGEIHPVAVPDFTGIRTEDITPKLAEVIKRITRLYDIYHHTESGKKSSGSLPITASEVRTN